MTPPWVLICGGFHALGGMDKANNALAEFLAEERIPLHLVANQVADQWRDRRGVQVHQVARPAASFLLGELQLRRVGRRVAQEVLRQSPQSRIVVNGGNCRWPDINWVHCVHHAWPCVDPGAPLWFKMKNRFGKCMARRQERRAISTARLVLANSERTRRDVITHLNVDPARVGTVYLGCDPQWRPVSPAEQAQARVRLGLPASRPLVAFVGALSLDSNKGFDILWSAWQKLCAQPDWDADLIVAGGGNAVAKWSDAVARMGLANRVRMLGFTDRVDELLAAVDVLVSPVRYEAYGLNVQEAICRGVPAIVSRQAGVAERYPSELQEMLLPDPEDVDDLVRRLLAWHSKREYWRQAFLPLSEMLRGYTWKDMARTIVRIASETSATSALPQKKAAVS